MSLLLATLLLGTDLRLELVRHSLTGTHCRYREYVAGLPTEHYVTAANCDTGVGMDAVSPAATPELIFVQGRALRRSIVYESPLEPYAYDQDPQTGEVIRRLPLFFRGKPARVFDPNPVAMLNDPGLRDQNDAPAAVPMSAYRPVELENVSASGPLRGPHATLVDRQAPGVMPPDGASSLTFDRGENGFEDVNAYYHIDRAQKYLQSLGYVGIRAIVPYSIEVDAHAAHGADNSFFVPIQSQIGRGTLAFGEGGTDDAEDADLVVHEYAHAMLEWIAPGSFTGSFASQARAMSEGFGDYWAFTSHVQTRLSSGRDPFCFADWDARCAGDEPGQQCAYPAGTDCLRRLDSPKTMAGYDTSDVSGVEHRNGTIWSSALREIHGRIGKTVADTIILESIFDLPPQATFASAGRRLIEADQQLYGGAHAAVICAAMAARQILDRCEFAPRGEWTHFQSAEHGLPIPDNSASGVLSSLTISQDGVIEDLFVRVDIAHPSRGDLRIELIAPDSTTVTLQQITFESGRDVHATFGLTATPAQSLEILRGHTLAGTWKLRVQDLRTRDAGILLSWGLIVKLVGAEPHASRPRGAHAQMVPVAARLYGAGPAEYLTDLRLANVKAEAERATLVFTRSGENGRTEFIAVDVVLAAGQTAAFDDVVMSAFSSAGSGSLEILGDVVVMSRTYARTSAGTLGQQVPANLATAAAGERLHVIPLRSASSRVNLGLTETAGGSGTVIVEGVAGAIPIQPFGHVQLPIENRPAVITVQSGDARIMAYASQISDSSGDPMLIPAIPSPEVERRVLAPAISAFGAGGLRWWSDVWLATQSPVPVAVEARFLDALQNDVVSSSLEAPSAWQNAPTPSTEYPDVIAGHFGRTNSRGALALTLPARVFALTRVSTDGKSQFIPFLEPDGPAEQHLLFVESGDGYRTNIGFVTEESALAELIVFDAGGAVLERKTLSTPRGMAQNAVLAKVHHGRALVRFLAGRGQAYASLVDEASGDGTFIEGQ